MTDNSPLASPHPRSFLGLFAFVGLGLLAPAKADAQSIVWNEQAVSGPSSRAQHAMAYDTARGVMVLFGGWTGNGIPVSGETWEGDGSSWKRRPGAGPSPRYLHAMAYDASRGVTVLFGGNTIGCTGCLSGETWEWNGTDWNQRAVSGPSPRIAHAMAYDSARGVTVLFGGATGGGGTPNGETWEWNGNTWTQRASGGPSVRLFHAMAYDVARHVTVLFGGYYGDNYSDTWEWNGTSWAQRAASGPSPRYLHAMAYDSARGSTVLMGGWESSPNQPNGETWEWNGVSWNRQIGSGPSPRFGHAMAYDSSRHLAVLFGGGVNSVPTVVDQTWELGCVGLSVQPVTQFMCPGGEILLHTSVAGTGPFSYQWRRGTSRVAIQGATNADYSIDQVAVADTEAGPYDCVVSNACGSTTSGPVTLSLCPADFNCDGALDFFDYDDFVVAFEAGTPTADFDHDGSIDFFDYDAFVREFELGC